MVNRVVDGDVGFIVRFSGRQAHQDAKVFRRFGNYLQGVLVVLVAPKLMNRCIGCLKILFVELDSFRNAALERTYLSAQFDSNYAYVTSGI